MRVRRTTGGVQYLDSGRPPPRRGPGRPVALMVHGTATGADLWRPVARSVAAGYRVLAPYLSGSGGTSTGPGPLTVPGLAAQVVATIEDAGAGPVHLAGHSLGAAVAAQVAGGRPDLVASLALMCGWVRTDGPGRAVLDLWSRTLADGVGPMARLLVRTGTSPGHRAGLGADGAERLVAAVAGLIPAGAEPQIAVNRTVDLRGVLAGVRARTLVVGCSQDQLVPVRRHRELAAAVRGAGYVELDAGHLVMVEHPRLFARTLTQFWDGPRVV